MYSAYSFVVAAFACIVSCLGAKLPPEMEVCHRSDPNRNECVAKSLQDALHYLKDGLPELGIPSAEPVKYDSITISVGTTSALNMVQTFTNVKLYDVINSKINKTQVNLGDKKFQITVYVYSDHFKMVTDYEVDGKVLVLPIRGSGKVTIDMYGLNWAFVLKGELYDNNGVVHARVSDIKVQVEPADIKFNYENLFNGNKVLGDEMNKLLNEHWRDVYSDVRGPYEKAVGDFCKDVFNAVFERVPYDDLFPL